MIIRVAHKRDYTVVSNRSVRDPRLSFRATGILVYVLSLPDGSELSGQRLTEGKTEGRDAVLSALGELAQFGYLTREKKQDQTGHWYTQCTIHEQGDMTPGNQQPTPGFQGPENRLSVNQASKDFEVLTASTEIAPPPPASPEEAPRFWKPEEADPATPEERMRTRAGIRERKEAM